ncbi:MAG TPA: rhombosortase [Opitutaceae bacterium]|nr:rhombosortase [Opitutaceae bacterium]
MPRRFPFLTAALTALALAVGLIPGAAAAGQYDRAALAAGQLWRLVTGHWAHWGGEHLAWDLLVFAVFGALLERRSRRTFALVVAGSALAISAALWFAAPQFQLYRGLSGVDSALFTAFFAQLLRDAWHERSPLQGSVPALALAGFVGKSAYELATGATLFVDTSAAFVAVPLAHLAGAAVGLVAGSRFLADQRCPRHLPRATALEATPSTSDCLLRRNREPAG